MGSLKKTLLILSGGIEAIEGIKIAKNKFEELLEFMIPMQIPLAYIEGYKHLQNKSLKVYPKKVKAIFTANS